MLRTRAGSLALCGLLCAIPGLVTAQAAPASSGKTTYQLSGIVTDGDRAPVPDADVTLIAVGAVRRQVVTGADGRFTLGDYPASLVAVRVRRLGYEQRAVDVELGAGGHATFVEIILVALPVELEEVVASSSDRGRLREFYDRKQQRQAFARFLELADIRRLAPANPSDLFRSVPGISIRTSAAGGNTIRIRGCQPTVWVDGQRIPGAELDEVVQASDIGAIEFYPSAAGIPAQYMDASNRLCGLILVWTRSR
jgi:hypothetical protein